MATASKQQYLHYREAARKIAHEKIRKYNAYYGFKVNRVAIKNHKSRWGSCSSKGNLNFNYRIVLLPERLADYVVVHELCHLGEFNHSREFWELVRLAIPEYKEVKKQFNLQQFHV